jgi:exodeoxyribonuclease-1
MLASAVPVSNLKALHEREGGFPSVKLRRSSVQDQPVTSSIFWYDYETTGINPRNDRPLQMAGIRTDDQLNEIAEPVNLYCQPSDDILPHPAACLVTGITPERLSEKGLCEADFMTRVHAELAASGTCGAGYNTLRFDDEMTRYSLYRNFFDPYGREWQGGNSRWDLIDVVRTAYALRPEGIVWPQEEGRVTLKLERLTAANGIDHGQAHDALSDVRATIALARLIRDKQPKLYDYLFQLRSKHKVQEQIRLLQPLVHISGRFSAARSYLGVVLPLAWHPTNRNALIVCDLFHDHRPLLEVDAATLRQHLYTRREELADGQLPVPLKLLHINKCPVIAPLSVLREEDRSRLQLDMHLYKERVAHLNDAQAVWQEKLKVVYANDDFASSEDPEQQLYDGFINDRDRRLCEQVRSAEPEQLAREAWPFDDARLPELLFRYRARNFAETLNDSEQQRWLSFCQLRLTDAQAGAPNTLQGFTKALIECSLKATPDQLKVLSQWQDYVEQLRLRLKV